MTSNAKIPDLHAQFESQASALLQIYNQYDEQLNSLSNAIFSNQDERGINDQYEQFVQLSAKSDSIAAQLHQLTNQYTATIVNQLQAEYQSRVQQLAQQQPHLPPQAFLDHTHAIYAEFANDKNQFDKECAHQKKAPGLGVYKANIAKAKAGCAAQFVAQALELRTNAKNAVKEANLLEKIGQVSLDLQKTAPIAITPEPIAVDLSKMDQPDLLSAVTAELSTAKRVAMPLIEPSPAELQKSAPQVLKDLTRSAPQASEPIESTEAQMALNDKILSLSDQQRDKVNEIRSASDLKAHKDLLNKEVDTTRAAIDKIRKTPLYRRSAGQQKKLNAHRKYLNVLKALAKEREYNVAARSPKQPPKQ